MASSLFGQSHDVKQQQSNGVTVLESKGVEAGRNVPSFKPNPVRTIDDWNLAECDEALRHIDAKITDLSPKDESYESALLYYRDQQAKINQRKYALNGR